MKQDASRHVTRADRAGEVRSVRMRPARRWAMRLGAVLFVLACVFPTGSGASAQTATDVPLKVVLIGDSYTAGNGAEEGRWYSYYGPEDCYRSHKNWGQLYADGLEGYAVTLVNRACSGAVTRDVLGQRLMETTRSLIAASMDGQWGRDDPGLVDELKSYCPSTRYADEETWKPVPKGADYNSVIDKTRVSYDCERWLAPQIEGVGTDADLVLLTLGGNDVDFAEIVKECFVFASEDRCRTLIEAAESSLSDLEDDLAEVLEALASRMRPDARIVVVSYPYLELGEFTLGDYAAGAEVRRVADVGDSKAKAAADRVNAGRAGPMVYFLDTVKEAFAGHEPYGGRVLANPDRWLNEGDSVVPAEWYHPNPVGQRAIADLVGEYGTFGVGGGSRLGSLDLVLAIDTTGSMNDDIEAVKSFSTELIQQLSSGTQSYRFALVTYRDHPSGGGDPGDYASRVDLDFSENERDVLAAIAAISVAGGGDHPESVYSGLMEAIALKWRPGVKKVVIQMGDAPPHDPEPVTGYGPNDVVAAAIAVDPAVIDILDVSSDGAAAGVLRDLASRTEGTVFDATSADDVAAALETLVGGALDAPYAWTGGPYVARIGADIDFDASGSFDTSGPISLYEWDLDGDGSFEVAVTTPRARQAFANESDGIVTLRVTDSDGNTSIGTARLTVSSDGDEVFGSDDNCPDDANHGQEDFDGDGIGDPCDPSPGFEREVPGEQATATIGSGSLVVLVLLAVVAVVSSGGVALSASRAAARATREATGSSVWPSGGGAAPSLSGGAFVIGRDPRSAFPLESRQVSAQHARIEVAGERVSVTDLGSLNGTFVNGDRVHSAELRRGDVIRFGDVEMRLEGAQGDGIRLTRLS